MSRVLGQHRGRSGHTYRRLREAQRQKWLPCWICQQVIDYDAHWTAPDAFALDHVKPLSLYPELAEDPSNFRSAHRRCNGSKGDREIVALLGRTSRRW